MQVVQSQLSELTSHTWVQTLLLALLLLYPLRGYQVHVYVCVGRAHIDVMCLSCLAHGDAHALFYTGFRSPQQSTSTCNMVQSSHNQDVMVCYQAFLSAISKLPG